MIISDLSVIPWAALSDPRSARPGHWLRLLSFRQRAAAVLGRQECLVAGHDGALLVVIPWLLRLGPLLHLEQIEVVPHAAVCEHLAALRELIVHRELFQLP